MIEPKAKEFLEAVAKAARECGMYRVELKVVQRACVADKYFPEDVIAEWRAEQGPDRPGEILTAQQTNRYRLI